MIFGNRDFGNNHSWELVNPPSRSRPRRRKSLGTQQQQADLCFFPPLLLLASFAKHGADPIMSVLVLHAETGASLVVPHSADQSVASLQAALQEVAHVPSTHQILLFDGLKLEEDRALAEYGLPAPEPREQPVFLFSRRSLSRNAPPPERRDVPPQDLELPTAETMAPPRMRPAAAESASPLVRALLDYERHFCLNLAQARVIVTTGDARIAAASRCLSELAVQGAAQRAAVANLRGFAAQLSDKYSEFQQRYAEIVPQQSELVRTFESDVEALRAVQLDGAIWCGHGPGICLRACMHACVQCAALPRAPSRAVHTAPTHAVAYGHATL